MESDSQPSTGQNPLPFGIELPAGTVTNRRRARLPSAPSHGAGRALYLFSMTCRDSPFETVWCVTCIYSLRPLAAIYRARRKGPSGGTVLWLPSVKGIRSNVASRTVNSKNCCKERGSWFRPRGSNQSCTRLNPQSRLHGRRNNNNVVEGFTSRGPFKPSGRSEGAGLGLCGSDLVVGRGVRRRFCRQLFLGPRAFALVVKRRVGAEPGSTMPEVPGS
jgi:hypothetical protein